MKIFFLTTFHFLFLVNAKLVTKTIEDKNVDSAEELNKEISISKEDGRDSSEYFKLYNKSSRMTRDSIERTVKPENATKFKRPLKPKVALVKKPIPKFTDIGSEEDYQAKIRFPNKYSDSMEHEDEDFNLDDYDFDVNHDEFAGRGKPLEPRVKVKVHRQRVKSQPAKLEVKPRKAPAPTQSKTIMPQKEVKASIKVARKAADKMKEEEYDDEFSASTKGSEKDRKIDNKEVEISDENEDSKEYENKGPVRTARSPLTFGTYVDRLGKKSSAFMSKILSYLPMFPQTYLSPRNLDEEVISRNEPMVDPWLGRPIV